MTVTSSFLLIRKALILIGVGRGKRDGRPRYGRLFMSAAVQLTHIADEAGRNTGYDGVVGHIVGHNSAGSHQAMIADGDTAEDDGAGGNPTALPDANVIT
jgi:hypothetical protein